MSKTATFFWWLALATILGGIGWAAAGAIVLSVNARDDLGRRGFIMVRHMGHDVWVPADQAHRLTGPAAAWVEAKP
jgi:hypothetical protein